MTISALEATNNINKNTTIKDFYNHVTTKGTNFNFDIDDENPYGHTALMKACMVGNLELAKALINMGANINALSKGTNNPLCVWQLQMDTLILLSCSY